MCKAIFCATIVAAVHIGVAKADDHADAKAILDAAIKAKGGEARLSRIVGTWVKSRQTFFNGDDKVALFVETFSQRDNRERMSSHIADSKVNEIIVLNDKEGWVKIGEEIAKELNGEQLAIRRDTGYKNWVTLLVPLKAEGFRLSTIDDISIQGRPAAGVLVSKDKHDPVKLYFDKETHLLVKQQSRVKNPASGKQADMECIYSDFRDIQGTRAPFKAEMFMDGRKAGDSIVVERELYDKPLDDTLFSKP
jgi:hypothetical protein